MSYPWPSRSATRRERKRLRQAAASRRRSLRFEALESRFLLSAEAVGLPPPDPYQDHLIDEEVRLRLELEARRVDVEPPVPQPPELATQSSGDVSVEWSDNGREPTLIADELSPDFAEPELEAEGGDGDNSLEGSDEQDKDRGDGVADYLPDGESAEKPEVIADELAPELSPGGQRAPIVPESWVFADGRPLEVFAPDDIRSERSFEHWLVDEFNAFTEGRFADPGMGMPDTTINPRLSTTIGPPPDGGGTLTGTGEDEILLSGPGTDVLEGGGGDDRYVFQNEWGVDEVVGGDGNDTLDFSNVTEALTFTISGQTGSVTVTDNNGNTVTATNVDNLIAGTGDSLFVFEDGATLPGFIDGGAGGTNTLDYAGYVSAVTVDLTARRATGTLFVKNIQDIVGGDGDDHLIGDDNMNVIVGGDGDDFLSGGGGDDDLTGDGDGIDDGIDTVSYESADSGVSVDLDTGVVTGGAGADILSDFDNIIGSRFGDTLTGDGNANVIQGGAGHDTIFGGLGDDVLSGDADDDMIDGGDGDDELDGGTGTDTLSYASAGAGVTVDLANTDQQDTVGAGLDTLSGFENIIGSAGDDDLTGDTGANTIAGGLGDDMLTGGGGVDTVSYESATSGVDVNLTTGVVTGGAGIDTLIGPGFDNVIGSANGGDIITGNNNDNSIRVTASSASGNTVVTGGLGTDTVRVNARGGGFTFDAGLNEITLDDGATVTFTDRDTVVDTDALLVDNTDISAQLIDLEAGLDSLADFAESLQAFGDNDDLLPLTSASFGTVAAFGAALNSLHEQFAAASLVTSDDVVDFLRDWSATVIADASGLDDLLITVDTDLLEGGIDADTNVLSFELSFEANRQSMLSLSEALTLTDRGVFLEASSELLLESAFTLQFSFGIDADGEDDVPGNADDGFFVQVESLTAGATADNTASPLTAEMRVGFLGLSVDSGTITLGADIDIDVNGGAAVTAAELDAATGDTAAMDALVDIAVNAGTIDAQFDVSVRSGFDAGGSPQGAVVSVLSNDFFAGPPDVTIPLDFEDFILAAPNELLGSLDQLGEWLATLGESVLLDLQIPFTEDVTIGGVLDFATAFKDDIFRHFVQYDGLIIAKAITDGILSQDIAFDLEIETDGGLLSSRVKLAADVTGDNGNLDDLVDDIATAIRIAIGDNAIADQIEVFQETTDAGATRVGIRIAADATTVQGVQVPLVGNETLSSLGDRLSVPVSILESGKLGHQLQFRLNVNGTVDTVAVTPRVTNTSIDDLIADIQAAVDEKFSGVLVSLTGAAENEIEFTPAQGTGTGTVRLLGVLDATSLIPGELSLGPESATFPTAQDLADGLSAILSNLGGPAVEVFFDDATREITFDLDWDREITLASVPINFGLDLGDFANVTSSTLLEVLADLNLDLTFGVLLAPTQDLVIAPPVFVPDLPLDGVLGGDATLGFDIFQDNFAEAIRLSTQLTVVPDTDGLITIDGGVTTFTWDPGDGTLIDDLSFALRITDAAEPEFVFGTLLAFDTQTNDEEADAATALGQDLQQALNSAFSDEGVTFIVSVNGNQLQISAASEGGSDGRTIEIIDEDEFLVASIDPVFLTAADTAGNDTAEDPVQALVEDLQSAIDAALMDAGIEPVSDRRLGLGDASLSWDANGPMNLLIGDGAVPENGVLRSDLRFMLQVDGGGYIFGIVEAADTIENETADDPIAALAEDVEAAINEALQDAGQNVTVTINPYPALGFDATGTISAGGVFTAEAPAPADGVLSEDLAFRLNTTGDPDNPDDDIFGALRASDTQDNEDREALAADLEERINEALEAAGESISITVSVDADGRLQIEAGGGDIIIDFSDNPDTRLQFEASGAGDGTLVIKFFSPAVVAVDAGNRLSLFAPAVAEEGSGDAAPKVLGRRLDIHIAFDDPAYTELGLNSSPIPFDGVLSGTAEFTLVVDGTRLNVSVDADVSNTSLDDLIDDINDAIAVAIAASADPTIELEARRVVLGEGMVSAGNRIEFVAAGARSVEILSESEAEGTLNEVAINELGFDATNSSEVRAQSGEFFLSDTSLTGDLTLAAGNISASAQFGFPNADGEPGMGLGVTAIGGGQILASAVLSLVDPQSGGSRVTLETLWETLGTADLDEIRMLVDAAIAGSADVDLTIQPDIPLATPIQPATVALDLDIADWLTEAPQVSDARDDDGELLDDGVPVTATVSGPDLNIYEAFSNLSFTDIIVALNDVVDYLRDVQGVGDSEAFAAILDTKLPLLNQSVSDLLDVSERFALFAEDAEENPSGSVQLLEAVIEDLLGLPDGSDLVTFSLDTASGVVLRLDLTFDTGIEESFGLDLQLEDYVSRITDGVPFLEGVKTLVGVSSTGDLDVEVGATLQLSLGLILDDSGVEGFLYTGVDGTSLSIDAAARGSKLDFTAQLGPFGFFVNDGTAALTGQFLVTTDDDGDGRFFFDTDEISVTASLTGSASADLPLFFPDESTPIGNDPDSNSMVITFGSLSDFLDGADDSVSISTPDLTAFPTPTLIGMLSNPEFLLDGLDSLLLTLQDALNGEIYGIELPFIGDQLEPAGQFVGDFREDVLAYLSLKLREGGLNPIDLVQETLYNVFGGADDGDPRAVQILGFDIDQFGLDGAGGIVANNDFDIENFDQQARFLLSIDGGTPELLVIDREDIVDGEGDDLDDLIEALQISIVARGLDQKVEAGREGNRLKFTALGGEEIGIDKAHAVAIQIGGLKVGALDVLKDFDADSLVDINDVFVSGFGLVDTFGQFDMKLGQSFVYNQPIDFDFGLPVLGFDLDAGIELVFEWELDFGFGVDQTQGFYFATKDNLPHDEGDPEATPRTDELSILLSATLTGGEDNGSGQAMLRGQLGFLALEVVDNNSFMAAEFTVDLADPNDDGFLTFSELVASSTGVSDVLTASLDVTADVMMDLTVNFDALGLDATLLPEISLDLDIDWFAETSTAAEDGPDIGTPDVNFNNIELDLGSFISDFAGPFLEDIGAVLEPLGWLLDRDTGLLYQRLPVISDLAGETVTLKRLAELLDTQNKVTPFLNAVEEIFYLVNLVTDAAEDAEGGDIILKFGNLSFGDLGGVSNLSDAERTMSGESTDIDDISNDSSTPQSTKSFTKNVTKPDGMLKFDILEPGNIIKLLVGDPAVDLVSYRLPEFGFDFEYLQRFPIYPPLFATLRGFFSSTIELGFGYDTFGLSLFETSDNPLDLLGGFFVDDLNADGLDIPEVTLVGGIAAGASLDVLVASAGVEGGIDATIFFNLDDPNRDGKVRLSEMAANILINSFNPLAIFDTSGKVDAFLRAYVEVLFGLWSKDYEIARVTLATFDIPYNRLPIVAQDMGDGELVINMGPTSASRIHGDLTDGAEEIYAKFENGSVFVWNDDLGEDFAQRFIGVERIVVNAGAGNDTVDFSRLTNSGIEVEIHGGTGNDTLIGGAGRNIIFGGEGNDDITGGGRNDELTGGAGDDIITGGAGNDMIMGGAGLDTLLGGDGHDELQGGAGDDIVEGGAGDDTYLFANGWGRDAVIDASGNDTWDFSATTTDITFSLGRDFGLDTRAESLGNSNSVANAGFEIENIKGGRGGDIFDVFQTGAQQIVLNGQAGSDRYTVFASDPAVPIEIALQDIGNSWDRDLWIYLGSDSDDSITVTRDGIAGEAVNIALLEEPDTDGLNAVGFEGEQTSVNGELLGTLALADGDFEGVARFELTVGDEPPVLVAVASDAVGGGKGLDDLIDALNQSLEDNGLGESVRAERQDNRVVLMSSDPGVDLMIAPVIIGPGIEALEVNMQEGDDSVLVASTRDDMAVIVRGEEGQDIITVGDGTVDNIIGGAVTGPLVIDGGEQADQLVIDDSQDDSDNFGSLTDQFVTGLDMEIQTEYRGIEDMRVLMGQGSDEFTIVNTITFDTLVHGGAGDDLINVEGIEGETNVVGGDDSDTFVVGSAGRPTTVELDLTGIDTVAELVDALNVAFASAGLSAQAGRMGDFITIETSGAVKPATLEIAGGMPVELLGFMSGDSATGTQQRLEARLVAGQTPDFENEAFTGSVSIEITVNLEPGAIGGGFVDDINANLFIEGDDSGVPDPVGVDTAIIDDSGATLDNTGNLNATQLTLDDLQDRQNQPVTIGYGTLETLNVRLGSGDDVFNVTGTSAGQGRVLGDTFGDIGSPNVLGTVIESGGGAVIFNVSSDAPLNLGNLEDILGALTVRAGDGVNQLNVSDLGDPTGDDIVFTDNSIRGLAPAPILYDATGAYGAGIHVFAGTGNDRFDVQSILAGSITLLHGSLGNDFLVTGALPSSNTGVLAAFGEFGDDIFDASASQDGVFLFGDVGEVVFTQDENNETLLLSARNLVPLGGGRDVLIGGGGDDFLFGGADSDILAGNDGNDSVLGDGGRVTYLDGRLFQVEAIDLFLGGADDLGGGPGNDTIIGGAGFDLLRGSLAEDILIFEYGRVTFDEQGFARFVVTLGQRPLDLAASTLFDLYLKSPFVVPPYFVEGPDNLAPVEQEVPVRVSTGELRAFSHDRGAPPPYPPECPDVPPECIAVPPDCECETEPMDETIPPPHPDAEAPLPARDADSIPADPVCHVRPWECAGSLDPGEHDADDDATELLAAGVVALGVGGWRTGRGENKQTEPTPVRAAINWQG